MTVYVSVGVNMKQIVSSVAGCLVAENNTDKEQKW